MCKDSEPLLPCLCRTHERRRPIPAGEEAGKAVSFRSKQRRRVTSTRPPWVEMETAPAEGSDRGLSTDTRLLPEAIAKGSGLHVLLLGSRRRCPPRELGAPWPPVHHCCLTIFLRTGRLPPGMFWETETLRDHLRLHPPRFSVRELTSPRF